MNRLHQTTRGTQLNELTTEKCGNYYGRLADDDGWIVDYDDEVDEVVHSFKKKLCKKECIK